MRIVMLSDTHGLHDSIRIPEGDILIHAGDLSSSGKSNEVADAAKWLGSLPYEYKIAIAGNHDLLFESSPNQAASLLRNAGVTYLQDAAINVEGLSIPAALGSQSLCIGLSMSREATLPDTGTRSPPVWTSSSLTARLSEFWTRGFRRAIAGLLLGKTKNLFPVQIQ